MICMLISDMDFTSPGDVKSPEVFSYQGKSEIPHRRFFFVGLRALCGSFGRIPYFPNASLFTTYGIFVTSPP